MQILSFFPIFFTSNTWQQRLNDYENLSRKPFECCCENGRFFELPFSVIIRQCHVRSCNIYILYSSIIMYWLLRRSEYVTIPRTRRRNICNMSQRAAISMYSTENKLKWKFKAIWVSLISIYFLFCALLSISELFFLCFHVKSNVMMKKKNK